MQLFSSASLCQAKTSLLFFLDTSQLYTVNFYHFLLLSHLSIVNIIFNDIFLIVNLILIVYLSYDVSVTPSIFFSS